MSVHPTAIVDDRAQIGENVEIGPYAIVEADVRLGDGVRLGPHSVIHSGTTIGARCEIHAHAVIGGAPQDKKHDGSATSLEIGPDNVIREFVTINRGSSGAIKVGSEVKLVVNSTYHAEGLLAVDGRLREVLPPMDGEYHAPSQHLPSLQSTSQRSCLPPLPPRLTSNVRRRRRR